MTRTNARELVVRLCFGMSLTNESADSLLERVFENEYYDTLTDEDEAFAQYPDEAQMKYISRMIRGICEHSAELDDYIARYAQGWQFARISRTALAIMKTAMFEILYMPEVPERAAINEAVELAKKYDEPETVAFVNGILGSFAKHETVTE